MNEFVFENLKEVGETKTAEECGFAKCEPEAEPLEKNTDSWFFMAKKNWKGKT